ncbi:hypothetical protein Q3G72_000470 [Acer saccharum]|nr:hypothetical protein Q3G72_000470 [Acer saccharum]
MSLTLRADRDIVMTAVRQNPLALFHATTALRLDREFIMSAVTENGRILQYTDVRFRKDREIVAAAVRHHRDALWFAHHSLWKDPDLRAMALPRFNSLACVARCQRYVMNSEVGVRIRALLGLLSLAAEEKTLRVFQCSQRGDMTQDAVRTHFGSFVVMVLTVRKFPLSRWVYGCLFVHALILLQGQ